MSRIQAAHYPGKVVCAAGEFISLAWVHARLLHSLVYRLDQDPIVIAVPDWNALRPICEDSAVEIFLHGDGSYLKIAKPRHAVLVCLQGRLWVTQSGDPRDYVLMPGQALALQRRGTVLATPLRGFGAAELRNGARTRWCVVHPHTDSRVADRLA